MEHSHRSSTASSATQDDSAAARKPWAVPRLRVLPVAIHTAMGYKTHSHKTFETYTYKQTS